MRRNRTSKIDSSNDWKDVGWSVKMFHTFLTHSTIFTIFINELIFYHVYRNNNIIVTVLFQPTASWWLINDCKQILIQLKGRYKRNTRRNIMINQNVDRIKQKVPNVSCLRLKTIKISTSWTNWNLRCKIVKYLVERCFYSFSFLCCFLHVFFFMYIKIFSLLFSVIQWCWCWCVCAWQQWCFWSITQPRV